MEEKVVCPSEVIDNETNRFPKKAGDLSNCTSKEEHLGPVHENAIRFPKLIHVVLHHNQPRHDDEWHNVPMVLLFSHFSVVIDHMQLQIELQIIIIVLRQKPALTVFYHKVDHRVLGQFEGESWSCGCAIQCELMYGKRHAYWVLATLGWLLLPFVLGYSS